METGHPVGGLEQHVTSAKQGFCPDFVEDCLGVHLGRETEGDAGREVRLDCAGDDVAGRALRGENEVDSRSTGLGGDTRDTGLHTLAVAGHEVGDLVDHDHDALARTGAMEVVLDRFHVVVECTDRTAVLDGGICKHFVTFFHHVNKGGELLDGILHAVDDFHVGKDGIRLHFGALGVDKDQFEFRWVVVHQKVANHGIEEHALAGAGLARDEHVGRLGQVELDRVSEDVHAHADFHGTVLDSVPVGGHHDGAARDHGAALVRELDADKPVAAFETDGLAGDTEAHGDVF